MALGFLKNELDSIESNPLLLTQSPPKSWLSEMINQWIQWGPGDARGSKDSASLKSLKEALLSINLARLACEFDSKDLAI